MPERLGERQFMGPGDPASELLRVPGPQVKTV